MLLKLINKIFKAVKKTKISIKITAVYAFMFSLVLLALNSSILYGIRYYFYSLSNKQIADAETVVLNKVAPQKGHLNLFNKDLFSDIPSKQNIFARILGKDGKTLNASRNFEYWYDIRLKKPFNKIRHLENEGDHLVFINIEIRNKYGKTAYLQIVKDMYNEYDFLKILFVIMAMADFIGIIFSVIIGYIVSKKMLNPIDYIAKTAENISINNLRERIELSGTDDELERLSNILNNMINRLQGAFDRQIQFVSDASHELKTPIAVIQGYANLLNRWGKNDKEALEKSVYGIKFEADNMANLVENLLFIAKGDSGTQRLEKKIFSLNELIDEVARESRLIAPNHMITNSKNDAINIFADYKMLKEMLRIFIDNSIKFSPEQSTIDISSEVQKDKIRITVSDKGIGIPKDEIEKIFDRFYRVDKSRAKEKGGTGLGLSIAKWIADMHKGTINVESQEGKYTRIIVILDYK